MVNYLWCNFTFFYIIGFESLANDDQIALLKGSTIEAMFLRLAQLYNEQGIEYQIPFNESKF